MLASSWTTSFLVRPWLKYYILRKLRRWAKLEPFISHVLSRLPKPVFAIQSMGLMGECCAFEEIPKALTWHQLALKTLIEHTRIWMFICSNCILQLFFRIMRPKNAVQQIYPEVSQHLKKNFSKFSRFVRAVPVFSDPVSEPQSILAHPLQILCRIVLLTRSNKNYMNK